MCISMLAYVSIFICLCLLTHLLQTIFTSTKHDRKLPPGPRALPLIGNIHMLGKLPHQTLHNLAKKYGSIMSMRFGSVPIIVVSSPESAKLFLKTHDTIFASRAKIQASAYFSYGCKGVAIAEYGPYWRNIRKLCMSRLLSPSNIETYAPMRRAELRLLVQSLKDDAAASAVVDLRAKIGQLIENMMCRMVFGHVNDDTLDLKKLLQEALRLGGIFNVADYVPFLAPFDIQGLKLQFKITSSAIDKILEKIIHEHLQDTSKHCQGFLDVLLSLMNQPMNPHDKIVHILDCDTIKAIILDMLAGGVDSSIGVIEWTLSELLRHPHAMRRLQEELESVVGMENMVEEKDLSKLDYLNMVLKESFRLHPIGPLLIPHESMESTMINGYYIPKKARILVNVWAIGRDPNVWTENVENFWPERFATSNIDVKGHDFELIPFGSGRRGCPGIQLGMTTVQIVLAQLVHCFNWELPEGMLANELDMSETFGITLPRANPLLARPSSRFDYQFA